MELAILKKEIGNLSDQEYMSDEQYALFEEFLRSELHRLSAAQDKSKDEHATTNDRVTDEGDKASKHENQEAQMRDDARRSAHIKAIRKALEAIRLGDYGFCISCGGEIGLNRLLAVPYAARDADCEHLHERKEKALSGGNYANSATLV